MKEVFINGRFLAQRVTGVQRYAREILLALDALLAEAHADALLAEAHADALSPEAHADALSAEAHADALSPEAEAQPVRRWVLLVPPHCSVPDLSHIEVREVGRGGGHLWEQLWLPLYARSGLLLGLGATGPLLGRHQAVTIHDASVYAVPEAFGRKFRLWYKLLIPLMLHRNARTMTVSEFSADELVRHAGARRDRLHVSGEGWQHVTRGTSDPSVLARHGLTPGGYVLAVSSVSPHKNFAVVERAIDVLERRGGGQAISLVVAGGRDARIFGNTPERSSHQIHYVGYVTDEALRALYENAAAFVFPSRYEGFGLPPLEAMALGCPVICARAASMPEVCADAALYFEPDNAEQLADIMARLMGEAAVRDELAGRASAVLERHSWRGAAHQHLRMVEELLQ